jgi:hypothetical protein
MAPNLAVSTHVLTQNMPEPLLKKRIIICCDGTWQSSNHGQREVPSNAAKMSHCLSRSFVNEQNKEAPQVVYYGSGVGTESSWLGKRLGGRILLVLAVRREQNQLTISQAA